MSFFGEMNGLAAHAEGSLFTFSNNDYDDDIALGEAVVYSGQQFEYAQKQHPQRSPTTTQPPVSIRSPLQAVIALASPTSLQQMSIWTPFALLRHRSRPIDDSTSINRIPDTAATQNPSKHMHSWTNPMAGMDLIRSEQPKNSIMKVRRLQDSIDSKYPGGSDRRKNPVTLEAPKLQAVRHDDKTSLPLQDCSLTSRERDQFKTPHLRRQFDSSHILNLESITAFSVIVALVIMAPIAATVALERVLADRKRRERQRQRTPDIFIGLREKPRFQGPKKSIWQAWERDEPHIDINKHRCILLRDVGGIASILKWEAAMEDEIPLRKPLSFVDQVGVKFIPRRLDKCNAHLRDLKESVKRNYSQVDEEVERRREWKDVCTRFVLSGFDRHYATITSQSQLRAAAREEASTTNSSDIDDDSTTTIDLSSRIDSDDTVRVSGSDSSTHEITNEDDDSTTTNDLSLVIDRDDTVRVSGSDFSTDETTYEDDDSTTTNDLSSRVDSDDTVRVSGSNFVISATTNEDDDSTTTNEDDRIVQQSDNNFFDHDAATNIVITVDTTTTNETPSMSTSSNTSRRRVPRPHRRTTIKSTEMEVDEATVWVNGRRRSSRLQPKTGSVWMNGRPPALETVTGNRSSIPQMDGFNPSNESLASRACGEIPSTIPGTNLESRDPPLDVLGSLLVKI
ncbi:hypothetical protein IV203_037145 [Nitzschia inconspicua]|uniref:Uncharacterized protein n=1 Tax=Nitzschia inconspicua TaxID=303405 RepID=A0A9K3PY24_9STRA|nr:hypothetical protein IV203_037145 [Nitzschia inconspicua]